MRRSPWVRSVSTPLLAASALLALSSLSLHSHDGFHPVVVIACMLPLQAAALLWACCRVPERLR
jgi:hypothetical protein